MSPAWKMPCVAMVSALLAVPVTAAQSTTGGSVTAVLDTAQAERMLELLRAVAAGRCPPALVDAVLAEPGTDLIIGQMNLNRKVTRDQYAEVLRALAAGREPQLPSFEEPRARKGIEGLQREVIGSLRWGAEHVDLLAERLRALRGSSPEAEARRIAQRFLPEPLTPTIRFHVVMGGRADATAVGPDIYFDVLAASFYSAMGDVPYPSSAEVVETFAHEAHHVGMSASMERQRSSLRLTPAQDRARNALFLLVGEGSASWLITAGRDRARLRRDPEWARQLDRGDELLSEMERLLRGAVTGAFDRDAYEEAKAPLLSCGFHTAGALMFSAIDRDGGLDAVLAVLRDPRRLVQDYDAAIRRGAGATRPFDDALAKALATLGQ